MLNWLINYKLKCEHLKKHIPIFLCDVSSMVKGEHIKDWHGNNTVDQKKKKKHIIMS